MKILSKLKYFLLVLFIVPIFVSAETVAKIGDNEYETLEAAITAATTEGTEIVLQSDYTITEYMAHMDIPEGKNIVINLNEHTLSGRTTNNGTVTVKNGKLVNNTSWGSSFLNNGTTVFDNVEILEGTGLGFDVINNPEKSLVVTSGTYNASFNNKGGTMVINSGTFADDGHSSFIFTNAGTLTVNAGTFTLSNTSSVASVFQNSTYTIGVGGISSTTALQKIVINGGTFSSSAMLLKNSSGNCLIEVNDGEFISTSTDFSSGSYVSVTEDPDTFIEGTSGIIAFYGGTYTAANSSGIFLNDKNRIIFGKNDGTVKKDIPTINIPNGQLGSFLSGGNFEFYDGTAIIKKNNMDHLDKISIPEGYTIKYDKNADNSYTAYLVQNSTPATPVDDVSEEQPTSTEEDIKNPNTGMFISLVVSSGLLVAMIVSIVVVKSKNKLYKI